MNKYTRMKEMAHKAIEIDFKKMKVAQIQDHSPSCPVGWNHDVNQIHAKDKFC